MKKVIRIGTRESQLALWQAEYVKNLLEKAGHQTELVLMKSEGEMNLVDPLYELGIQGIFTKTLDAALLAGRIDIAVHSLKDVPTQLAKGLYLAATPPRANHLDLLILKNEQTPDFREELVIASGSLRRQAQWLNRYPHHRMESIRGNINSRLNKLAETEHWSATVMAAAGVERIALNVAHSIVLDWMLPAPSQGALGIFCREEDEQIKNICMVLNHEDTHFCTQEERMFLRTLMGGCTMPIAAHAHIRDGRMFFKGNMLSPDGSQKAEVDMDLPLEEAAGMGKRAAVKILASGGQAILEEMRNFRKGE